MDNEIIHLAKEICVCNKLKLIEFIGKGGFKKVFKVKRNQDTFALKIIPRESHRTLREIKSIKSCNHPNIARLINHGSHIKDGRKYYYIIEEYLPGGTLLEKINESNLTTKEIIQLGTPLIDALAHLYERKLVHRDIKPKNIMFRKDKITPVLIDFGVVRDLSAISITRTSISRGPGTPLFMPPEQLKNKKSMIDWRTDQFSLGIVLFYARFGFHPYHHLSDGDDENQIIECIIDRVANYGERREHSLIMIKDSGLFCLEKMTSIWPFQRYRFPQDLAEDWQKQG